MGTQETIAFVPRGCSADSAFCEYVAMVFKRKCRVAMFLFMKIDSTKAVELEEKGI